MKTLDGQSVYLWSSGDLAIATTSATEGAGRIVAAFSLQEDADSLNAQIQMVALEQLDHPIGTDPDDELDFTDVLNVSASGSITFDFDELKSGSSLWVAVGNAAGGLLVTGGDPVVDGANKKTNASDVIHTSRGGPGDHRRQQPAVRQCRRNGTFTYENRALGTDPDAAPPATIRSIRCPTRSRSRASTITATSTPTARAFSCRSRRAMTRRTSTSSWEAGGDPGSPPQTDEDLN